MPHIAFLGTETVQRESANGNDKDNAEERETICAPRPYVRPFVRCVVVVIIIAEKPAIHVMPRERERGQTVSLARGVVTKQWIVMLS